MIIFLHGNDSYRKQERLHLLKDAFKNKFDEAGMNIATMYGDEFTIDEFRKHTKSAGLFSKKRFIIVRDLWKLKKDEQEQLQKELTTINDDTILVIEGGKPPRKDNKLFKLLLANGKVENFPELETHELGPFIDAECKKYTATITSGAKRHLIKTIGSDLWKLSKEIKKLAHQSKKISQELTEKSIDKELDENIFHLTDALGAKNVKQASKLMQQQFQIGANEQYIISMLGRHIATVLKVKKSGGEGLGLHPYVLKKSQQQAKQFKERQLLQLFWKLLTIDEALKTTSIPAKTKLDTFIIEACK